MKRRIIKGEPVSQQDIERFIQNHRKCHYEMEKNKIRLDNRLTPEEKSMKLRMFFYREQALKTRIRD